MDSESSWEKMELEVEEKRRKALSQSSIQWLDRPDFWSEFKERYKKVNRGLGKIILFPMALEDIRPRIDRPPVFSPLEEDFPGPVERWYGRINGNLFALTFHYHPVNQNLVIVAVEDDPFVEEEVLSELTKWRDIRIY